MEMTVYDAFFRYRFQNLLGFNLSTLENAPLSKPFEKASVFIKVSGGFRVDDRRERIKKVCVFKRKCISVVEALALTFQLRLLTSTMFEIRGFPYIH